MIIYESPTSIGRTDVVAFYTPTLFVVLVEISPGVYQGELPDATPEGTYPLTIKEGVDICGHGVYEWDGSREVQLSRLASDAAIARMAMTNSSSVNIPSAIFETLDDDGNVLVRFQTFNAAGEPSVIRSVRREKLS